MSETKPSQRNLFKILFVIFIITSSTKNPAQTKKDSLIISHFLNENNYSDSLLLNQQTELNDWHIFYSTDSLLEIFNVSIVSKDLAFQFHPEFRIYKNKEIPLHISDPSGFMGFGKILSLDRISSGTYLLISEGYEANYFNTMYLISANDTSMNLIPVYVHKPNSSSFESQEFFSCLSEMYCSNFNPRDTAYYYMKFDKKTNIISYKYTTGNDSGQQNLCETFQGKFIWKRETFYQEKEHELNKR